jgi:hypothetical protein
MSKRPKENATIIRSNPPAFQFNAGLPWAGNQSRVATYYSRKNMPDGNNWNSKRLQKKK